jgi:hypothetical protein
MIVRPAGTIAGCAAILSTAALMNFTSLQAAINEAWI